MREQVKAEGRAEAKILLPDDCDFHAISPLRRRWRVVVVLKVKLQHWSGFQGIFGLGDAPVLDFCIASANFRGWPRMEQPYFFGGAENAPAAFIAATLATSYPSTLVSTSSVCSPSSGERSIFAGEAESLIGMPTFHHLPRCG